MVEHKCPKCGKSMIIGWLGTAGTGWICWTEGKGRSWAPAIVAERLESLWRLGGLRAYRCKECGIFICYERGKQPE